MCKDLGRVEILPDLQANKLACYSLIDTVEDMTSMSENKERLLYQ